MTVAYGKKIDALRGKFKAFLDGEFRDTLGAEVNADGSHRYSVLVADGGTRRGRHQPGILQGDYRPGEVAASGQIGRGYPGATGHPADRGDATNPGA